MDYETIHFILVLLESEGVVTKEQRRKIMVTVSNISQEQELSIATNNILDTIGGY